MATRKPLLFFLISALLLLSIFKFTPLSQHLVLPPNQAYTYFIQNLAIFYMSIGKHVYIDIDSDYYQKIIRQSRSLVIDGKDMVVLNENNFSQFMKENQLVMEVNSIGSPCHYWSREPAATIEFRGGEVVLVKLAAYKIKPMELMEGSPTIYFYQEHYDHVHDDDDDDDDTFPVVIAEYNECGREAVMTWVKRKMRLGVYNITTMDEAKRVLAEESKLVLGFLRTLEGPEIEELAAASKMLSDISFYQTTSADVAEFFHIDPHVKRPTLILLHTLAGKYSVFDDQFTRIAIADFLSKIKLPLVISFTAQNSEQIFQNPMKQLWLFAPTNGSEEVKSTFEEVAEAFKEQLLFVYVDMKFKLIVTGLSLEFGITGDAPRSSGCGVCRNCPAPSPQDHNGPKLPPKSPPPPSFSPLPSANSYPPPEWAAAPPPPGEARKKSAMSGGQKAGIAVGVLAGAAVIGLGGMVYKKRRSNIRRAHFGQAARRSFL
ncbi:hypothetical protein ACOSQ2_033174 [Xanthoceras sorbifolium]